MSQFVAKKLQEAMNGTPQGASELKAMLERAVLEERKACAKIAREFRWFNEDYCPADDAPKRIAKLIEERSNKQ